MLTDVFAECLVEPLHAVGVLLRVLRDHGNDGAHQLLSNIAARLQDMYNNYEAKEQEGKIDYMWCVYSGTDTLGTVLIKRDFLISVVA